MSRKILGYRFFKRGFNRGLTGFLIGLHIPKKDEPISEYCYWTINLGFVGITKIKNDN